MSETLIGLFLDAVQERPEAPRFRRRTGAGWETIDGRRALADVEHLALGLAEIGVARGDRVAILSENRYEWPISDLAVLGLGAVTVPIYPTLTAEQCRAILEITEAKVAIVSGDEQLSKLHRVAGALPELRTIVHMDMAEAARPIDRSFAAVQEWGASKRGPDVERFLQRARTVGPGDLATIIFTSGTTGEPKGAMLSHGNIASNVNACLQAIDLRAQDTCLSFLPLSHIFERMAGLYAMLGGRVTIAYAQNVESVAADALEVRPTVLVGVPRFFEKVYARVQENAAAQPALRRRLFEWGLARGRDRARAHFGGRALRVPAALAAALADRLVGAKIRARVGGRIRFCVSGGAPLHPAVMEFFFAVGIPVVEGYGLTETSPVITLNPLGAERPGSVGKPISGVEVRIGEEGEILTRGPHVMQGYYQDEEATRRAITEGWFHTGDVGRFDDDGYLFITDRLKELLLTAGGKLIAPQPIEARLKSSPWVAEAVLLGDRRPYVVCLLVPAFGALEERARARGWNAAGREELIAHPEAEALFTEVVAQANEGLARYEQVKRFALLAQELTLENGELTPTLKVKRRRIHERYGEVIARLYEGHATPGTP